MQKDYVYPGPIWIQRGRSLLKLANIPKHQQKIMFHTYPKQHIPNILLDINRSRQMPDFSESAFHISISTGVFSSFTIARSRVGSLMREQR